MIQPTEVSWEAVPSGIKLWLGTDEPTTVSMPAVREMREDMEEAQMLSRGCEKLEVLAKDVQQHDKIWFGGNVMSVSDVLLGTGGTVLQFGPSFVEISVDSDDQITVYRAIE